MQEPFRARGYLTYRLVPTPSARSHSFLVYFLLMMVKLRYNPQMHLPTTNSIGSTSSIPVTLLPSFASSASADPHHTDMSHPQQGSPQSLPQSVLVNVLCRLPTSSLFTASLVSAEWRRLIFESGPISNTLLRPHLSVLRERFGFQQVPHRIPIPAVRKLLVRYAKQELSGTLCAKEIYNIKAYTSKCSTWNDKCIVPMNLRRFAVCGSLLAIATSRHIYVFELTKKPIELLTKIPTKKHPIALAISGAYLAVLDEEFVSMYSLLARNKPSFMVVGVYSIKVPQIRNPTAIAITPGIESTPLVAVLATSIYLIHPSYALTQKRGGFFRDHIEGHEEDILDPSRKGKEKEKHPLSRSAPAPKKNPWLLATTGSNIGASFPLTFAMYGRQVSVSAWGDYNHDFQRSGYLGSLWSNEDPVQLKRRQSSLLMDGENVLNATYSPDQLWRYYNAKPSYKRYSEESGVNTDTGYSASNWAENRWQAHTVDTKGEMTIESAIHLYDSFYIVTEVKTRLVRIISIAPFASKVILYRRTDSDSETDASTDTTTEKAVKHCGYVVAPGGKEDGYIAFNHRPGFIKILPLRQIPMHSGDSTATSLEEQHTTLGREVTGHIREIGIGEDENIVGMDGDARRLIVVLEERVVVVRLWCEEKVGRSVVNDIEPDWEVDRFGEVRYEGKRSLLRRRLDCTYCVVQ